MKLKTNPDLRNVKHNLSQSAPKIFLIVLSVYCPNGMPSDALLQSTFKFRPRIFMLDRQREEGELRETFSVLGSTGNVGL